MTREQRIIALIDEAEQGIDTITIAKRLGIARENVSRILNQLVKQGKINKSSGKPVVYTIAKCTVTSELEDFEQKNPSLKKAISQAKSSILYPPHGINTLIIGETGVGKSHFAEMMYRFSISTKVLAPAAPFILFNCADYAKNPELLLGTLFGVKKGAYTGADEDKTGLIELADQGMLFLDEIHNLPQEGQEILFTFIDQGVYRRLGESEVQRRASVRIIGATSESILSSLVGPFRRRMPMLIELPSLKERTEEERANLIQAFFEYEARVLDEEIFISKDVFISLLFYECPYNIGQLKSDIQLLCAKAYSEHLLGNKAKIEISSADLPKQIAYGLWNKTEHRSLRTQSEFFSKKMLCFSAEQRKASEPETIYSLLQQTVAELSDGQVTTDKMKRIVEQEISDYFSEHTDTKGNQALLPLETIIDTNRMATIREVITFVLNELPIYWDQNVEMGFTLHLHHLIERIKNNTAVTFAEDQVNLDYQLHHRKEFLTAVDCLQMISFKENIQLPYSEANNLVSFFINTAKADVRQSSFNVQTIVIAHGETTATSMAKAVNQLLKKEIVIGIDAPLDEKPLAVMNQVTELLRDANQGEDILCLVDMGSFLQLGPLLEKELHVRVRALPLVSTIHVLEAARKTLLGNDLKTIYNDLLNVNFDFFGCHLIENTSVQKSAPAVITVAKKPFAIVTCCLTGHGTAIYLKQVLERQLTTDDPQVEVIPVQLVDHDSDKQQLLKVAETHEILAVVATFPVDYPVRQFNVSEVISGEGLLQIKDLIQDASIGLQIRTSLKNELQQIDGGLLFDDILAVNEAIEQQLRLQLNRNELIGVIMHTAILIDKVKAGERYLTKRELALDAYQKELAVLRGIFYPLEKKYDIRLTLEEYFPILEYYLHLR